MKNIISTLFTKKSVAQSEKNSVQLIIEASVNASLKYVGLNANEATVISAQLKGDSTGSWCVVTFFDDSTACRMNYTAYVDIYTKEVCGFSGEADKTWIDYPARYIAEIDPANEYFPLAIAV